MRPLLKTCIRMSFIAGLLFLGVAEGQEDRVVLSRNANHESIWVGDVELLRYNKVKLPVPVGIDPGYARSGYIHPIRTPAGVVVTGDFAPDHAHQHALFSAWVNTTYDGRKVDFWNQQKALGRVSFLRSAGNLEGVNHSEFTVVQEHQALLDPGQPLTILEESWRVWADVAANAPGQEYFVFNVDLKQTNLADKPLIINEYHYGGMALRGNNQWFSDESAKALKQLKPATTGPDDYPPLDVTRHRFLTSEGKRRLAGNHSRPNWVDLSGFVDGNGVGITVMSHPSNFRHPQPVRLHPTKPYFCFAPCVLGSFEIEAGGYYSARYRYIVHDGGPDSDELDRLWNEYAKQ